MKRVLFTTGVLLALSWSPAAHAAEAETFAVIPSSAGATVSDATASGHRALQFRRAGKLAIPGTYDGLTLRARAQGCSGGARLVVRADAYRRAIAPRAWTTYRFTLPATGNATLTFTRRAPRTGCRVSIDTISTSGALPPTPWLPLGDLTSVPTPAASTPLAATTPANPQPTTPAPTTPKPITPAPTSPAATTPKPTTPAPTSPAPTTPKPTTPAPTTPAPTTPAPTTPKPTTPAPTTPAPTTPAPTTPKPTAFYLDTVNPTRTAANAMRAARPDDAALLDKLAQIPNASWVGAWDGEDALLDRVTKGAVATHTTAAIVVYGAPHRDVGQFSAGGLPDAAAYRAWIDRLVTKIGSTPSLIVVEPDAAVQSLSTTELQTERYALLTYAVKTLGSLPNAKVYLDAGTLGWKTPATMITRLKQAGVAAADGIALNTSNFHLTSRVVTEYGRPILAGIGGNKGIVVDTARNGNGPLPGASGSDAWCNPAGRGLGAHPTANPGMAQVDAFIWAKRPGSSDGGCRGLPATGEFMPEFALQMIRDTAVLPW